MGFSFNSGKRRAHNSELPEVQKMLAVAAHYGFNRGLPEDRAVFGSLVDHFGSKMTAELGSADSNWMMSRGVLDLHYHHDDMVRKFPIAVDAAWMAAVWLHEDVVDACESLMGHSGKMTAATVFVDFFPGKNKTLMMGRKEEQKVSRSAVAAVILMSHADELGLTGL